MHPEAVLLYFIVALRSRAFLKTAEISLVLKISSRETNGRSLTEERYKEREREGPRLQNLYYIYLCLFLRVTLLTISHACFLTLTVFPFER